MNHIRTLAIGLTLVAASITITAQPASAVTRCKTTLFKYDHKTWVVTWFTIYKEMRFCYDGTNATSIQWTDNRTSNPTLPYGRGGVSTLKLVERYDGSKRRARNQSRHSITCAKVLNGFDVTMRQLGYGSGSVTKWRSSIDSTTDC